MEILEDSLLQLVVMHLPVVVAQTLQVLVLMAIYKAVVMVDAAVVVVAILVDLVLGSNLDDQDLEIMEILVDVVIVEAAVDLVLPVGLVMVVMVGLGI